MSLLQDVSWAAKYAGGHVPIMELVRIKVKSGKYYLGLKSAEASFLAQGDTDLQDFDVCVDAKQFAKISNIKKVSFEDNRMTVNTGQSKISFTVYPGSDLEWPKMPDLDYPSFEVTSELLATLKELAKFGDSTSQAFYGAIWLVNTDIIAFTTAYCAYRKISDPKETSVPIYIVSDLRPGCICYSTDAGTKVVYDENHKITFNTTDRGKKAPHQPIKWLEEFKEDISFEMTPETIASFIECMAIVNPLDAKGNAPVKVYEGKISARNDVGQDFEIDIEVSGTQNEPYYLSGRFFAQALSGYKEGCTVKMQKIGTVLNSGEKHNSISNIFY